MMREPDEWTLEGFLSHFQSVHSFMPDHPFCWIIGAGASKSSGIPTGAELAEWWLRDLHERECSTSEPLEKWATAKNLNIGEFSYDRAPEFYPQIYQRRFKDFPDEGYAYLEHVMTGRAKQRTAKSLTETSKVIEPGPGYSFLAKILENTSHRAVITTNFDNLVADALQIFTSTYPFVCGHESLTGFVRVAVRRPIVCKIHRDLLLGPFNEPRQLRVLHEAWAAALRALLGNYTPIVIGYGGNDDSLMERLASLDPSEVKGRLIWCYYQGTKRDSRPSQRIRKLVGDLGGVLVPVPDFDRLMILLGARINIEPLDEDLKTRLTARIERYTEQLVDMPTSDLPQLRKALSRTYARAQLEWWQWELKIDEYDDPAEKESLYREALQHCRESPELTGDFANLMRERGKHDEAERLYRAALELDSGDAGNVGNLALFLTEVLKDHDEAERLYKEALKLDPENATHTGNFALFMTDVRGDSDEAERLFRKAVELDPTDASLAGNFAHFLIRVRELHDEAERLYRMALELDPGDAARTGSFAVFLAGVRKQHDEAERLFRKSLELDQRNAAVATNFGNFLSDIRNNSDEAEHFYRKAVELEPDDARFVGNLALFLKADRKEYDEAEALFRKALELDPAAARNTGNFADFLTDIRKEHDEADSLYRKALELDPGDVRNIRHFASFLAEVRNDYDEAERYLLRAMQLDPSDFRSAQGYALVIAIGKKLYRDAAQVIETALQEAPDEHSLLTDLAEYRICDRLEADAAVLLERAQRLMQPDEIQARCIASLNLAIVCHLSGSAPEPHFEVLERLLQKEFSRDGYNYELVLGAIGDRLPRHFVDKCRAYGSAIANADQAASLRETLAVIEKELAVDAKKNGKHAPKRRKAKRQGNSSSAQ